MTRKSKKKRFGDLPPSYNFALNPYPDARCTTCPQCRARAGQRKLPLLIHVDPMGLVALNYTNRYCKPCDLLIGQKHEIEHHLTVVFGDTAPEVVGNSYLIIGTVEKRTWRENARQPKPLHDVCAHTSDFESYRELRMKMMGWFPPGQEPPIRRPPGSMEWVKTEPS